MISLDSSLNRMNLLQAFRELVMILALVVVKWKIVVVVWKRYVVVVSLPIFLPRMRLDFIMMQAQMIQSTSPSKAVDVLGSNSRGCMIALSVQV